MVVQKSLNKDQQARMGQFFTPSSVAMMMSGMFTQFSHSINLLDPGAGVGSLSAAFIARALESSPRPKKIHITAFELDPLLIGELRNNLTEYQRLSKKYGVNLNYEIHQEDFISSSVEVISREGTLFSGDPPAYNYTIMNPPYKKINTSSKTSRLLHSVGIDTTNMYTAFLWLGMRLLLPGSEMVAIVPRSFCNGPYFKLFRQELLQTMAIRNIHVFGSRDKAFKESNILQENIIFHAVKGGDSKSKVVISTNDNPSDDDLITQEVAYEDLVQPDDPDFFIRIIPDRLGHQINSLMDNLTTPLKDLGVTVSTGPVVDFRVRDLLKHETDTEMIPLIYPHHFKDGYVKWPGNKTHKPAYLRSTHEIDNIVAPSQFYVLVKRFSSKEEKRRIYAAVYDPTRIPARRVGIENHLNFFHRRYGGLSQDLAKGLAIYLNSTLVDQYFRLFSGHTQVNATDLRNLKYPTEKQLIARGREVGDRFPDQDGVDQIITQYLIQNGINGDSYMNDPIQAKKRIKESLNILQLLNVPKAQQNDRSALTLLALANLRVDIEWRDASENLMGITEMMDYFRDHYGINYAPNTRETVRRQTIHQFMQIGLAIANPDDPNRPINSPKTKYILVPKTLELIRTYNSKDWETNLAIYLRSAPALANLQVRERVMPMIPITLPDGEKLMLSSGGQNELIKKIVEEFCPRYTPGGKLIYIGDAGEKVTEQELQYFEKLGFKIDKHGKMPDIIIDLPEKKWLVLIEAVTSHGPIDLKRHNELKKLFTSEAYGLIFVTAFESRKIMNRFLNEIAWETEVWVSEAPSHLIHFNGERFLGPYME
ncbi:MAG: Eco57I restriction-modification methylase domain-containing protein [Anaerolineaceae bacterium]|nr:Eco57I restriction-modification methylase domain-containing protein [Anaerolineaceae bacterium]